MLDAGYGSRRGTAEVWLNFKGAIKITAINPVPGMIELACEVFESHFDELDPQHPPLMDKHGPTFEIASATQLAYPNDSFDACVWPFVLHWKPDQRQVIHETVWVVRPGGAIFGVQPFKPETNPDCVLVVRRNCNSHGLSASEENGCYATCGRRQRGLLTSVTKAV